MNEHMVKAYKQGYMDKLSEYGIKQAADPVSEGFMALPGQMALGMGNKMLPLEAQLAVSGLTRLGTMGAGLAGYLTPPDAQGKKRLQERSVGWSAIPGVNSYNRAQRRRGVNDESIAAGAPSGTARNSMISELLGPTTSMLGATGLGAGLGAGVGSLLGNAGKGAVGGAAVGMGGALGANIIGVLAAAIRDRRSKKEQTDVDSSSGRNVAKYLVPGVSIYDYYKRLGRSRDW